MSKPTLTLQASTAKTKQGVMVARNQKRDKSTECYQALVADA